MIQIIDMTRKKAKDNVHNLSPSVLKKLLQQKNVISKLVLGGTKLSALAPYLDTAKTHLNSINPFVDAAAPIIDCIKEILEVIAK